jgi:hypothetical protein
VWAVSPRVVSFGMLLGVGVVDTSPAFERVWYIGWAATGVTTRIWC